MISKRRPAECETTRFIGRLLKCAILIAVLFTVFSPPTRSSGRQVVESVEATVITVAAQERNPGVMGSGVIVSKDGFALTNAHVVGKVKHVIAVLKNGERLSAKVVVVDTDHDLALIRIDRKDLQAAEIGDAKSLRAGDDVTAIGAPLGLAQTVTRGIISNANRKLNGQTFLQTDAAINRGSSGGPLFTNAGKLVGINTKSIRGAEGLSMSIPINTAYPMLQDAGIMSGFWNITTAGITAAVAALAAVLFVVWRKRKAPRNLKIKLGPAVTRNDDDDLSITLR